MENPGCVTFRDPLVFSSRVTRAKHIARASTIAHEMAHQWFGDIVTPAWWDDLWLNESFAEYLGNRVTADVTEFDDVWTDMTYARRQWGLVADQGPSTHPVAGNGAVDASAALQDFDGISYAKGSSILKQLNASMGDQVFFDGVIDHLTRHRFGNATMLDLFESWERAGAGELDDFTTNWLRTSGPDTLSLDRAAGVVRRTPPAAHPADRPHTIRAAVGVDGTWSDRTLELDSPETPFGDLPEGSAVILDAYAESWVASVPDPTTVRALVDLLPEVEDDLLRAGIWDNLRSGYHHGVLDPADVLDVAVASLPVEDTEDSERRTMHWLLGSVVPLAGPDAPERVHAAARREDRRPPSRDRVGSSRRSAPSSPRPPTSTPSARWVGGADLPEGIALDVDLRWRVLVRLATLGAVDLDRLDAELAVEPTGDARVSHAKAQGLAADAGGQGVGVVLLHRRDRGRQLRADRRRHRPVARRPGGGHRRRTSTATSPTCPRPSRCAAAGCSADAAQYFFPRTSLEDETLAKAQALVADGVARPVAAPPPGRRGGRARAAAGRAARLPPMSPSQADRPRPPSRAHRGDRAAPRGPGRHRGAARDPAGLARRGGPAGVGDHADARVTTSSSPPAGCVHEGLATAVGTDRLLHRPGADRGRAVQRRHGDPRRRRRCATRAPARPRRRPGRRRAGSAARTASPTRSAVPAADAGRARCPSPPSYAVCPTWSGPSSRSSSGPAASTRPPWPPRTARCSWSARTSAGTTRSTR